MHISSIPVDGRRVSYVTGGRQDSSRVLVLLHAFPLGVAVWTPQLDAFPDWRVLVPALPGFNGSDLIDDMSIDGYAAHMAAFIRAMGIERACVGGLSLGGYVLLALMRLAPDLVSGVVLADTRSTADGAEARASRHRMLEVLAADGVPAIASDVIPKLLAPSTRRDLPEIVALVRDKTERQPPSALAAAIQVMLTRPDATPVLPTIRVPTLVVVGEEDILTPPAEAERLHAAIPGSTLVTLPGAGHLSSLEAPHLFNRAVAAFLPSMS